MKKGVCIGIACMMLALSGCAKEASRQVYAMDTVMNFTVYGKNAEDVLSSMEQRVQELENLFSRTRRFQCRHCLRNDFHRSIHVFRSHNNLEHEPLISLNIRA